ncbi:MAG: 1-deoxy-D-xylulose-5-phosphate synthase [Tissierellales bacterium]|jgi:1-deoxy-D-xylulose-5-phosphate synthase|nr:1-deoxy-D-xylulose-5-phosphate synthase [Tissierellales bacterium]
MKYLENINLEQLKKMNSGEMRILAEELRRELINIVSKTGGHLASNLGVVEITLAIHKVFDSPKDKIIWDVGHQSYIHKMLTGRLEKMNTIRQFGGLSGFPKRKESEHDAFEVGHSSTSISAGIGMALSRDIRGESHNVISVIGDGAMTAGMAYEAINQLGALKTKMIIILNDNEMSIDKNVGGMAAHFNRLRTAPQYRKLKTKVKTDFKSFPRIIKILKGFKTRVKYFFVPGVVFEEMGLKYIGPVDGHNIDEMLEVLDRAKRFNRPVLIHAITQKGRGFGPAEKAPENFHGVSPFDIETGEKLNKNKTLDYSAVLGNELVDMAKTNRNIVAITAAMPKGTGLNLFKETFESRYFDVGIAEQHGVTLAAGMAATGIKPYFVVYSSFLQRGYDQVLHDVCIQNLPVVFAIDRGGLVGDDGETHHGVFDFSYLSHIPNMTIMSPKDYHEFIRMIRFTEKFEGPIALRYPRGVCEVCESIPNNKIVEFGKAEILKEGSKVVILAIGDMVKTAYEVALELDLAEDRIGVVNMRFVKPIDEELLDKLKDVDQIVTLENNVIKGGMASQVNSYLLTKGYKGRVLNLGIPDEFIEHGNVNLLKKVCGIDHESIKEKIKKLL